MKVEITIPVEYQASYRAAQPSSEKTWHTPLALGCQVVSPVVSTPQGAIVGSVNRRKGVILNSEQQADDVVLFAEVPLNNMFGYSTELRSMTQGKGEFSMEYVRHSSVMQDALVRGGDRLLSRIRRPCCQRGAPPF